MAQYDQEYFVKRMLDDIRSLKSWKPNILFRRKGAIGFREVEDLIAWMLRNSKRILAARDPAWRFICREGEECITIVEEESEAEVDELEFEDW